MTMRTHHPRAGWADLFANGHPALVTGATPQSVADRFRGHAVYLATPYSHQVIGTDGFWDLSLSMDMQARASRACHDLARVGVSAIPPITIAADMVHNTDRRQGGADPLDDAFWSAWCEPLMRAGRAFVVPEIKGWQLSRGVWREVLWALDRGVPVFVYADRVPDGCR